MGIIAKDLPELHPQRVERFWASVDQRGADECWSWRGSLNTHGYGRFKIGGRSGTFYGAHRIALKIDGREPRNDEIVDHICRNRSCVNPSHLRVVDARTNMLENSESISARYARRTHCPNGHELSGGNLSPEDNRRRCVICRRASERRRYHAALAEAL